MYASSMHDCTQVKSWKRFFIRFRTFYFNKSSEVALTKCQNNVIDKVVHGVFEFCCCILLLVIFLMTKWSTVISYAKVMLLIFYLTTYHI